MKVGATLFFVASVLAAPSVALAQAPAATPDLPAGYWPLDKSQPIIARTGNVRLSPPIADLGDGERAAIAKLLDAGAILQRIHERQLHPQAVLAQAELVALDRRLGSPAATQNLLTLYRINQGPIADTLDNKREAFLPVEMPEPATSVYPFGIAKTEIETWLGRHPEQRDALLSLRTAVRRADAETLRSDLAVLGQYPVLDTLHPGLRRTMEGLIAAGDAKALYAVPYAVAYADEMMRAYALLNEAAAAVQPEDGEFAGYLRNRARDLLSGDYESGDAAWATGRFKNLNAQIGSYETYSDELYGAKTFMSLSLMRMRLRETEELRQALKGLQGLEDALPYTPHKKVRDDIAAGIYDVIADFGQARGANTATVLPNEAYLSRRYGRVLMLRANIMNNPEIFENARRSWRAVMAPAHHDELTMEGAFFDTLWHEVGHYLGVERTRDGRRLDAALQEAVNVLEELKADLVSLFAGETLHRRGYYTDAQLRALYASGTHRALVSHKPRPDEVYETMQLIQWNYFMANGLMSFDKASGRLAIHYERYHEVVTALLAAVLELQSAGDKSAADKFIAQYTTWDDSLHAVVAKAIRDAKPHRFLVFDYDALGR